MPSRVGSVYTTSYAGRGGAQRRGEGAGKGALARTTESSGSGASHSLTQSFSLMPSTPAASLWAAVSALPARQGC